MTSSQEETTFPIQTKQSAKIIDGIHTEVLISGFRNKIFVVITQYGKIVDTMSPLRVSSTNTISTNEIFLLGSYSSLYQIYASQIANTIVQENPNEGRSIIVGIALMKKGTESMNEQEGEEIIGGKYLLEQVELMVREYCTELKTSIARIKACSINRDFELVAYDPPSFQAGLFGYHLASLETETIILAGNEFDAMAAYQETKIPAFCLPTENSQLHLQILPLLHRFSKIYVWLDDDVIGQDMSEMFVKKLGIERCLIVNTRCGSLDGPLNASQALIMGRNLIQILSNSKPLPHEQIINFDHIKDGVYREIINPDQVRGVMSNDLPALNKTLKGHRPVVKKWKQANVVDFLKEKKEELELENEDIQIIDNNMVSDCAFLELSQEDLERWKMPGGPAKTITILIENIKGETRDKSIKFTDLMLIITSGEREAIIKGTPRKYAEIYTACWQENPDLRPHIDQVMQDLNNVDITNTIEDIVNLTNQSNNELQNDDLLYSTELSISIISMN
ncbi:2173_t:CDS:2 [Entrophospora sp. SA101]|nr:2173_t:CDS:2 [Entrophospora sp. SA101]